jgi:uncharacterized protein YggU (UPF0235/DUF167 family)
VTTLPWLATPEGIVVRCRLTPKGGADAIEGVATLADGASALLARVRAAPEKGKANEALRLLLAETLRAPMSGVKLIGGVKSRLKRVAVAGDPEALAAALRRALGG